MEKIHKQYYNSMIDSYYSTPEKPLWISLCPCVVRCSPSSRRIRKLEIARALSIDHENYGDVMYNSHVV